MPGGPAKAAWHATLMSDQPIDQVRTAPGGMDQDPSELEPPAEIHPRPGLRRLAARGVIVNSAFQVGFAGIGLLRRVLVAAFLTQAEFGLWGILIVTILTLSWLKQLGIADKYVQQTEPDQELAFQKAFTLELMVSFAFFALVIAVLPLYAIAYGHAEIIGPGILLATVVPISALQTPIWIPYRRLEFVRQRTLLSVDPLVGFVVTVVLGALGAGYWCLVIGSVAGAVAGSAAAVATCPYPIRLRFDRGTLKEYVNFSWPLFGLAVSNLIFIQGTLLVANRTVGLAGVGAIGLAGSIAAFADRCNGIVSSAVYPAICRVADRTELLHEAFVKSNRLILMWAIPFGVGLSLFAGDFVDFVLGERWLPAKDLLIGLGLLAGFGQIAFNWSTFMRAVNKTKPMLFASLISLASFAVVMVPALLTLDLIGYVVGLAAVTVIQIVVRDHYLRGIFPGFGIVRHLLRSIAPTVPAAGLILIARLLGPDNRTEAQAIGELVLYAIATVAFTLLFERRLLREVFGYLRRRQAAQTSPDAVPA
jgi:O-antigen/teichoic acid export membrane protein